MKEAVQVLSESGVSVKMITGDALETALAIGNRDMVRGEDERTHPFFTMGGCNQREASANLVRSAHT